MNENGYKLYELTIDFLGIQFRHINPNPLSANQKFTIILTLIGAVSLLGLFLTPFFL